MKSISVAIILGVMLLVVTGCVDSDTTDSVVKGEAQEQSNLQKELKVLEVKVNLKEPEKEGANFTYFLQEEVKDNLSSGSKNAFNVDLKKCQHLKIETDKSYPITIMLKDNSNQEYVYKNTLTPKDNEIITDSIEKSDNYELMNKIRV